MVPPEIFKLPVLLNLIFAPSPPSLFEIMPPLIFTSPLDTIIPPPYLPDLLLEISPPQIFKIVPHS